MYTFTINPVTPKEFQEKKEEILASGLKIIPQDTTKYIAEGEIQGTVMGFDIKLGYRFDGGTLEVDILKKPFLASNDKVESKVKEWFV